MRIRRGETARGGRPNPWRVAAGAGAAASAAFGILVLAGVFIAVVLPRASLGYRTRVLQQTLRAASPAETTVLADADITGLTQSQFSAAPVSLDAGQAGLDGRWLAATLRRAGLPLAPAADRWLGVSASAGQLSGAPEPRPGTMQPPMMELFYRSDLDHHARLIAGSLPTRVTGGGGSATFPIAVTAATAARLGLHVGSRLQAAGQALVVTGIIRPADPASAFWTVAPYAAAPLLTYQSPQSPPFLSTGAFVGATELPAMETLMGNQQLDALWAFPLALGQLSADQAAGLLQSLQRLSALPMAVGAASSGAAAGAGSALEADLSAGLGNAGLPSAVATDAAVQRALSPLFVSLAAVAAVVVLLGAMLVAEHRRGEFALWRARGASSAQVAALALRGAAATVLPAVAIAVTAGILVTPGPSSVLAMWLAAAIAGAALAAPPLLAVWQLRATRRADSAPASRRGIGLARRWVIDGALGCAAVGGLVVLRQQGLPPPGRLDVFTSLAPVLAAVPIALLIARCYPLALGQLARLARRRRGVVLIIGLARGRAAARATVLPAFALILVFAVVAFAAMARDAVVRADVAASWRATPADAVVTAPGTGHGLTPAAQRMIAGVPGAQHVAMLAVTTGSAGQGLSLPVAVVNPRQYAALVAATPAPRFPAGLLARPGRAAATAVGPVPALISPAAGAVLGHGGMLRVAGRVLRLRVAGRLAAGLAGLPPGGRFVVIPGWALGHPAPQPTVVAIQGPHLDAGALARVVRRAVPGAHVTLRSRLLAAITGAPLPRGGFATLAQGAVAAATFGLLILLLMLVSGARSRELTLARLATMGLGHAESRRITAVETLPVILSAVLGGSACALTLAPLVGPAVDLAAFTGEPQGVPLRADPLALGAVTGGLLLLAGVTLTIQGRLARRRGVSQALRAGE